VADPESQVVRQADYERVIAAASRLSEADREVLRLAAWEELSHTEIAMILDCSVSAVDQRLHRAKKRLTRQYQMARPSGHQPSSRTMEGGAGR